VADAVSWAAVGRRGALVAVLGLCAAFGWAAARHPHSGLDANPAQAIIEQTNAAREADAQPPLTVDPRLTLAAEAYARDMARRRWFDHIAPDGSSVEARAEAAGYGDWLFLAENLATGSGPPDATDLVASWLNSPGHRRNILSPDLREIGVGCYLVRRSPVQFWCVQEFGTRAH